MCWVNSYVNWQSLSFFGLPILDFIFNLVGYSNMKNNYKFKLWSPLKFSFSM